MLDIPEEVKDLFKQESIRKNFRIHFPNGEESDICNDRLEEDSVSFTESICSRDKLKFGLCEASTLQFNTANVGNIKGAEIEASLEVDCSSLIENAEEKDRTYQERAGTVDITDTWSSGNRVLHFTGVTHSRVRTGNPFKFIVEHIYRLSDYSFKIIDANATITFADYTKKEISKSELSTTMRENKDFSFINFDITYEIIKEPSTTAQYLKTFNLYLEYDEKVVDGIIPEYLEEIVEYPSEMRNDNGYLLPVVSLPIGHFYVDSCDRNVSNMQFRSVTAYTVEYDDFKSANPLEKLKYQTTYLKKYFRDGILKVRLFEYLINLGLYDSILEECEQEILTQKIPSSANHINYTLYSIEKNGIRYRVYLDCVVYEFWNMTQAVESEMHYAPLTCTANAIYKYYDGNRTITDFTSKLKNVADAMKRYGRGNLTEGDFEAIDYNLLYKFNPDINKSAINYYLSFFTTGKGYYTNNKIITRDLKTNYFYPGICDSKYLDTAYDFGDYEHKITMCIVNPIAIKVYRSDDTIHNYSEPLFGGTLTRVSYPETLPEFSDITLSYEVKTVDNNDSLKPYILDDVPSCKDILEGFAEINGGFLKVDRKTGLLILKKLKNTFGLYPNELLFPRDNLYPKDDDVSIINLTPNNYYNAWYDEDTTKLYSKVIVNYKDKDENDEEKSKIYEVRPFDKYKSEGSIYSRELILHSQTYDVNNYLLSSPVHLYDIYKWGEHIADSLEGFQYMPAEIECVGLPYMEAGDIVNVFTDTGGFETIALRRTLKGIQRLTDTIESRG